MDMNAKVGSPSKQTDWGFIGYLKNGTRVPIGVYKDYRDGRTHANAWMRNTPQADRWEGERLHEELTHEEYMGCLDC